MLSGYYIYLLQLENVPKDVLIFHEDVVPLGMGLHSTNTQCSQGRLQYIS